MNSVATQWEDLYKTEKEVREGLHKRVKVFEILEAAREREITRSTQ